jgi:hypothetical protein
MKRRRSESSLDSAHTLPVVHLGRIEGTHSAGASSHQAWWTFSFGLVDPSCKPPQIVKYQDRFLIMRLNCSQIRDIEADPSLVQNVMNSHTDLIQENKIYGHETIE